MPREASYIGLRLAPKELDQLLKDIPHEGDTMDNVAHAVFVEGLMPVEVAERLDISRQRVAIIAKQVFDHYEKQSKVTKIGFRVPKEWSTRQVSLPVELMREVEALERAAQEKHLKLLATAKKKKQAKKVR